MQDTFSKFSPPVLIYLGMGLVVARILLDGIQPRRFTWLRWLQFLVDASRIVLLWPLVLFIDKLKIWLTPPSEDEVPHER
jgi:hypothetical protein